MLAFAVLTDTYGSVWSYKFSYSNIEVRRRIGIIANSFIRPLVGSMSVGILQWREEVGTYNGKPDKYPFKSKYQGNVCPQELNNF